MSPYRKRFVQFNMLLIGIVLTIMVAAVAVYMVNDYYNGLRVTMEQVVAPLQGFSQPPKGEPPEEKPGQGRLRAGEEYPHGVLLPGKRGLLRPVPEQFLYGSRAARAFERYRFPEGGLWHPAPARRHLLSQRGRPCRIAIASTDYITRSVGNLALVLLAIWLRGHAAVFCRQRQALCPRRKAHGRGHAAGKTVHRGRLPRSENTPVRDPCQQFHPVGKSETPVGSVCRWVDSTQEAAKRMQQLISQMLTLADVERSGHGAFHAPLSTLPLSQQRRRWRWNPSPMKKHVTLEAALPEECTPAEQCGLLAAHRQQPAGKRPEI